MPSRRRHHRRGPEQQGQDEDPYQQQLQQDDAPSSTPAAVAADIDVSGAGVLTDEEDSYRLVLEHDEHLARIRAYTDFHDVLARMRRAAVGGNDQGSRTPPHNTIDLSALGITPTSREASPSALRTAASGSPSQPPPPRPSQQRADEGDAPTGTAGSPTASPLRRTSNSTVAQEQDYELHRSPTLTPTAAEANKLASRLQAENTRLAADLQASQEAVQRLHASLREARAALQRCARMEEEDEAAEDGEGGGGGGGGEVDVDAATGAPGPAAAPSRPPQRTPPASVSSLFQSTSPASISPASSLPATAGRPSAEAVAALAAEETGSDSSPMPQRVLPQAPLVLSSPSHTLHLSPASRQGGAAAAAGGGGLRFPRTVGVEARAFDVAEFFWTLRVAPPPSALHTQCAGAADGTGHCHAVASAATPVRPTPRDSAAAAVASPPLGLTGVYGAVERTPINAAPLASNGSVDQMPLLSGRTQRQAGSGYSHLQGREETEEEAALACESAWVDSTFYCYNIMDELSSLRVVASPDDVADNRSIDAGALPLATEEDMTRHLLNRTPANTSLPQHPSPDQRSLPSAPSQEGAGGAGAGGSGAGLVNGGSFFSLSAAAAGRRYRLPYLQRLWVTAVLRHLLLFLLVILTCLLVFVPGIVLGTVNVFEAAADEDFFALRNRYGRSALLVVARLVACTVTFLGVFCVVCVDSGRQQKHNQRHEQPQPQPQPQPQHEYASLAKRQEQQQAAELESSTASGATPPDAMEDSMGRPSATADTAAGSATGAGAAAPGTRPTRLCGGAFSAVMSIGTLVQVVLCAGAALMLLGAVLLREGCRNTSLPLAILGEASYGAGEAMLLGGLGIVICAEVGVAAGVSVSLQMMLLAWLIINACGSFLFPKLSYYVYTTAAIVDALVYTSAVLGAFVLGVVTLCPRDLIERAVRANARDISPRKLWSAARHDVSMCFLLRTLTVGLLTAAVVLLMTCGKAVFIPTDAVAAAVAESAKSRELMGTGTGKTGTASDFLPGLRDRWAKHQEHALVLLFTYALVAMPFCFIPRLASLINRWCPVPLLTTLLCVMWMISAGASWAPLIGLDTLAASASGRAAATTTSSGKKSSAAVIALPAVPSWLTGVWLWLAQRHFLNPRVDLCGLATGLVYTVVASSLLRSIANAGVQLPVMHPLRWRMAFHRRDRRAAVRAAAARRFPGESSPLLPARWRLRGGAQPGADAAAAEAECPSEVASPVEEPATAYAEELQRCARMQLRGGPAVMAVLGCTLVTVVLLACVAVMAAAAAMLTSRDEAPVHVAQLVPNVTLDEHLVVKSIAVCVLMLAMLVQWAEVTHRACSCLCCCC